MLCTKGSVKVYQRDPGLHMSLGPAGACMGVVSALTMHLYQRSSQEDFQESAQAAGVWLLFGFLTGRFW